MQKTKQLLKDRIAIVGYGKTGSSLLKLLLLLGIPRKQIAVFDEKSSDSEVDYRQSDFLLSEFSPTTFFVSPGFPLQRSWLQDLSPHQRILSEFDLGCDFLEDEQLIAITGSAGKSTTTSLIGKAARIVDPMVFVGGNLGTPFADYLIQKIQDPKRKAKFLILELSSFQLELFRLTPAACVFVSLLPNHLDRYQNVNDYYSTKWRLAGLCKGPVVFAAPGGDLDSWVQKKLAASSPEDRNKYHRIDTSSFEKVFANPVKLLGAANQSNLLLAAKIVDLFGWPSEACLNELASFPGLEHRYENCGKTKGVQFINDSKATTIESVNMAIANSILAFPGQRIVFLIGGRDKDLPWNLLQFDPFIEYVFFGECGKMASHASQIVGTVYSSLASALQNLLQSVQKNSLVVLSPGGSSLDEFQNFEARGNFFKNQIQAWKDSTAHEG